ncbi:MAG: Gfo/Idh/MocA family oxidoreductase [Acidobacteria bacterium]|nr:Gfo/Idh/MocA family oxidoreductase [Acidobacteriota bacterium]
MSKKHAIALVGCGEWGKYILRDLRTLGCEVLVVARSPESRLRATEGGALAIFDSARALPKVDGVVIASSIAHHAVAVEEFLDRGVPLFVEKPLTSDPAVAARLAESGKDRLFVMDKWRYHPGIEMLARIAQSGELGRLVGLHTVRLGWGESDKEDPVWRLAPHDLAIALEVLGTIPRPRSAVALMTKGMASGLIGILGSKPWFALEVSARHPERRREVRLHCQDGMAVLPDAYSPHIELTRYAENRNEGEPMRIPISGELPLLRELHTFVKYLEGGPRPRSSALEGAAMVDVLSKLRELAGLPH